MKSASAWRPISVIAILLVAVVLAGGIWMHYWRAPVLKLWNQIRLGDTEQRVLELLGPPARTVERDTAPPDYYKGELAYRERPITNKVFIYRGKPDLTMFVWFDEDDRVEDVFIGGS